MTPLLQAQLLRVALEVSVLLVVVYGITTSSIGSMLRTLFTPSLLGFMLISCPYCVGWWVSVLVSHWAGDVALTPLYFMAIPIAQRVLPDFITGPQPFEVDSFDAYHKAKAAKAAATRNPHQ